MTLLQNSHSDLVLESLKEGLQSYVSLVPKLTPTTNTGIPAAGTFYSTIINRAPIVDISKDLKVSMGVERIPIQAVVEIQDEYGPNLERVFSAVNDSRGLIRFVGNWVNINDIDGNRPQPVYPASTDYVEITFFGTGLNMLSYQSGNRSVNASIDGGSVFVVANNGTSSIASRNYNQNVIIQIASGLTLGVHTVKIIADIGNIIPVYGFEVVNVSSTLNVNPGIAYIDSQKVTATSAQSVAYKTGFETGTLGIRGGRALVYLKSDGAIGKAVTPVNAAQAVYAATDHSNEEVVRAYHFREFGAGRTDDFSRFGPSDSAGRAFTLEDGVTTLTSLNPFTQTSNSIEGFAGGANTFIYFTFIGTGIDVFVSEDALSRVSTYAIDGISLGVYTNLTQKVGVIKIASGLPYGTHTLRITTDNTTSSSRYEKFIVYQPKKPTLPAGAIELADYNILADYVASTTVGADVQARGVMRKMALRETIFNGTFNAPTLDIGFSCGFNILTNTIGSYAEYSFFGTGFEIKSYFTAAAINWTISVDGSSNLSGFTTGISTAAAVSFTASTGVVSGTGNGTHGNAVKVSGLTLGYHKVRVTQNATTGFYYANCIDVVTPIHSAKSNLYGDIQNTLPVGSCAISDNRKTTIVKDAFPVQKAWAQAIGVTSGPTSSSTSYVPVPDMSLTIKTNGNPLEICYSISATNSAAGQAVLLQIYVDGIAVGPIRFADVNISNYVNSLSDNIIVPVSAGVHTVQLYWRTGAGTLAAQGVNRLIKAREI